MSNVLPITGGMGASLDDNTLAPPQPQAGLEIGVVENKIAFRLAPESGESFMLLFSIAEMFQIMAAEQAAIDHIRQNF